MGAVATAERWFDESVEVQELMRQADKLCFLLDVACDRHRPCGWPDRPCPYCQAVSDWRATRHRWAPEPARF